MFPLPFLPSSALGDFRGLPTGLLDIDGMSALLSFALPFPALLMLSSSALGDFRGLPTGLLAIALMSILVPFALLVLPSPTMGDFRGLPTDRFAVVLVSILLSFGGVSSTTLLIFSPFAEVGLTCLPP